MVALVPWQCPGPLDQYHAVPWVFHHEPETLEKWTADCSYACEDRLDTMLDCQLKVRLLEPT